MMCPGGGATLSPACHQIHANFNGTEATVLWDCHRQQLLSWSNGAPDWIAPDPSVSKVHIVYMTHLDVGFTNTSRNICDLYFDTYFPRAWNTSEVLRKRGGVERYQWTEFPWLIQEYLDGAAQCGHKQRTPAEVAMMEQAIARDDIIWHGNALNNFLELEDAPLFNFSLQMAKQLNSKYSKTHGTVAGKHTDVPGMSKSAIPILSANGIQGYHIGYNGACKKPESVPAISRWQHSLSGTEVVLMAEDNYGTSIRAPGSSVVLAFMYQIDNTGPPSAEEVVTFWEAIRTQYPSSTPIVSSLDGYVQDGKYESSCPPSLTYTWHSPLVPVLSDKSTYDALPVLTGEIGDSWLYGSPADPIKLATYREARRTLHEAVQTGVVAEDSVQYNAFMRRLLKGPPEHNWGWATSLPVPTINSDPWVRDFIVSFTARGSHHTFFASDLILASDLISTGQRRFRGDQKNQAWICGT
jgi:hypothetical protein